MDETPHHRISELESALRTIKRLCSVERESNWESPAAVAQMRMRITDLCEIADQE